MKTHALTLPDDLHARLRAEAAVRRLSLGDTIRLLLDAALTVVAPAPTPASGKAAEAPAPSSL